MSWSDGMENSILDHVLGGGNYTRVSTVWIALSTTQPTEAGSFTEPTSATAYLRVPMANTAANWPAAAGGIKQNGAVVAFPEATGAGWGTVSHFAIMNDAALGGPTMMAWGQLALSKLVSAGDGPQFKVGSLAVTQD
jgi:hypothetical protein